MQIFTGGNQISTVKHCNSLSPRSPPENRISLSLYCRMMNRDLVAKDNVKLRLADAARSVIWLMSLHGLELLSSSGVDLYKFQGDSPRGALRLGCLPSFPANGSHVKCFLYQIAITHLWYKYILSSAVFWMFGYIQSFDLQVNAFILNSSIVGQAALLESISSLYF